MSHVGRINIGFSMLDIINGWIYRLIERLWALPDDLFELEDDENAIIEE